MSNKLTESKEETNEHNDSFNVIEQGSSDRNRWLWKKEQQ